MTGEIQIHAAPPMVEWAGGVRPLRVSGIILTGLLLMLAIMPYLPVFTQPFISDDYIQLDLGRRYGPMSAWGDLAGDVLYRCRATSILVTHWTEAAFGKEPSAFYTTSLLFHVANTFLVFLAGWKLGLGGVRSYLASSFFAVQVVHQEAVMWYAALPELLVFLFCALFVLSWNSYVRRESRAQYWLAMAWFLLALLSKEAGVALVPVAAGMLYLRGKSSRVLLPFAGIAAVYTVLIFAAKSEHLHLNDGTFSVHAPFLAIWARSLWRLFGVWGVLGVAAIAVWNRDALRGLLTPGLWCCVTLLPYSFLLYMPVVPSRHTYLASAGVGFFVATGLLALRRRFPTRPWVMPLAAVLIVTQCSVYLWTKKRQQFLARAEATEELIRIARQTDGPIYIQCMPYGRDVAVKAIEVGLTQPATRLVWSDPPPGATTFCAKNP